MPIAVGLFPYGLPKKKREIMGEIVEFYDKDDVLLLSLIMTTVPRRNETVYFPTLSKEGTVEKVTWTVEENESPIIKVVMNKLK